MARIMQDNFLVCLWTPKKACDTAALLIQGHAKRMVIHVLASCALSARYKGLIGDSTISQFCIYLPSSRSVLFKLRQCYSDRNFRLKLPAHES